MTRTKTMALWLVLAAGCSREKAAVRPPPADAGQTTADAPTPEPYADFPLYGRMEGAAATVRKDASPEAIPLGWLRRGERVRLKSATDKSATCQSGWYPIYPRGFVCGGEGLRVSHEAAADGADENDQARRDAAMPYDEYLVKEAFVPEYHQVPSRDQQRAVTQYVDAYRAVVATGDEKKQAAFLLGGHGIPAKPAIVRRFLDRGFYVASTGVSVRQQRSFVRTVRGSFVKEQQLELKETPKFAGVELSAGETLPIAWAVRGATPQRLVDTADGKKDLVDATDAQPIARLTRLTQWNGWERSGGHILHALRDGTYLRAWYVAVAEAIPRPKEVRADETWLHVDVSAQTLVLYVGDTPKFATIVSTGVTEHPTALGSFRIQRKYVTDSMSDIGADEADDRYSIDDVPWTQYFDGSRALHGAFWHTHYGMPHSHGCVNLAPNDALYVFRHTAPRLPDGWHGISAQKTGEKGSLVVITE